MTAPDPAYARIVGPFCDGVRADYAAQLVELPCATPGCTESALVHPTTMAAFGFDESEVRCSDCVDADPTNGMERCVACGNPLTDTSELIDSTCTACFRTRRPASVPPGFFPDRDVIDWEMGWMRLLNGYEAAVETVDRLMDEATSGYDAEGDLNLMGASR